MSIVIFILTIILALICGFIFGNKITKKYWGKEYYSMANKYHKILRDNNLEHINREIYSTSLKKSLEMSFKDGILNKVLH